MSGHISPGFSRRGNPIQLGDWRLYDLLFWHPSSHFTVISQEQFSFLVFTVNRQFPPPKKTVTLMFLELSSSWVLCVHYDPILELSLSTTISCTPLDSRQTSVVLNSTHCNQGRSSHTSKTTMLLSHPDKCEQKGKWTMNFRVHTSGWYRRTKSFSDSFRRTVSPWWVLCGT